MVSIITKARASKPTLVFTDDDLPPERTTHKKSLYISLSCAKKWNPLVLVDNGLALNVCPQRTINKVGVPPESIKPSNQCVKGYDNSKRNVVGCVTLIVEVEALKQEVEFFVMDIPATFNLLLGRPWLHETRAVPSTLHQKVKFVVDGKVITMLGDSSIRPRSKCKGGDPVLELGLEAEETFLTGFSLDESRESTSANGKKGSLHEHACDQNDEKARVHSQIRSWKKKFARSAQHG
ncbi:hypothetical protein Vadar_016306 [Vaccinium darrowii]|uniref:Uncharacterized protein n=1 Tax=Vaccinium darrowii TaxID=229202 RepID=A0ACB7ZKJ3_9ERIC|nr:hypothetical protein Vadar_016306 [Vaccinium darrowii]